VGAIRRRSSIAALAVAAAVGASCLIGLPAATAGAANAAIPALKLPANLKGAAPSTVKIALGGGYTLSNLPFLLAYGAGYFNTVGQRFHTTISLDIYGSGATEGPAYFGGVDQWLAASPSFMFPFQIGGKDALGVWDEYEGLGTALMGQQKFASSRGTNVSAYGGPGNTWCQITAGGVSGATAKLAAGLNHVNLANQNVIILGTTATELPTLQNGTCQITAGDPGQAALGAIQGVSYLVDNTATPTNTIPLAGEQIGAGVIWTSHPFLQQYPKLSQAMVDAMTLGLLVTQQNAGNPNVLYNEMPSAMTATYSLGAFAQVVSIYGSAFSVPAYCNGEFPVQSINDTVTVAIADGSIPVGSAVNPSQVLSNKYVIQAYKDLNKTPVGGPAQGPAVLPSSTGKPSLEAATAYSILLGGAVPANSGPAPMGAIAKTSSSSTTSGSTTSTTS
jgi:hypothetical protein